MLNNTPRCLAITLTLWLRPRGHALAHAAEGVPLSAPSVLQQSTWNV
ncbi:hypothetical protein [Xanthomonas fragariae]|nr:hypothetical protein [Xanthomonas fragariae]WAT16040.1 hypothetical protein OZ429_06955 [Xanthomonas fragariae]